MRGDAPDEPWRSFLVALDASIPVAVDLHCIGGFVVSQCYGLGRETADLDVLSVAPTGMVTTLTEIAGPGSALCRKYGVYLDIARVGNYPAEYASRLLPVFSGLERIRLWALEPHDLALTKLERSNDRDIRDVMFLAQAGLLQAETLQARFASEFEPYVVGPTPTWHRTTLAMWMDACWPGNG